MQTHVSRRARKRSAKAIAFGFVALSAAMLQAQQPANTTVAHSRIPADPSTRWVDNTSGPFYTGTADTLPGGSFYVEPYAYLSKSSGIYNFSLPLKFAYGIGHHMEADATVATEYNQTNATSPRFYELGDTVAQLKVELHKETDRYRFWRAPSVGLSFDINMPTGHLRSPKLNLAGGSQTTNNTWNEQVNILTRKQFKPFQLYLEGTEIVQNPTDVVGPYDYNNGLSSVPMGTRAHVVDGNVLAAAATLEHVLVPRYGLGYLVEMNTQRQFAHSLFWGKATAPAFSYLNLSPEMEFTWPAQGHFPLTWGAGLTTTAYRNNSPRQLTPLFTVTLNGNLHGAR